VIAVVGQRTLGGAQPHRQCREGLRANPRPYLRGTSQASNGGNVPAQLMLGTYPEAVEVIRSKPAAIFFA
jgi:hypothetical protein